MAVVAAAIAIGDTLPGTVFLGLIGLIGLANIKTISKLYGDLTERENRLQERERSLLTRENHQCKKEDRLLRLYRIAPSFPVPSQIDEQTVGRALEKINNLKSYQWALKQDKVDREQVLEYWKLNLAKGTCVGQVSALLHANKEKKDFSLKKSFERLTLEEIFSRHCARMCDGITAAKKAGIPLVFKAKQIKRRLAQIEAPLQQALIDEGIGIPSATAFKPLKQLAKEISDSDLERIVDQIILQDLKLGVQELTQWVCNPPEISAADRELKLKKYEREEKLLAKLMAYPFAEVYGTKRTSDHRCSMYNAFPAGSSPEMYQAHLEKAIASFPSRIRDGVITGSIIIRTHAIAFQYSPEYFIYDPLDSAGLFEYPDKESFFESIYLMIQTRMPCLIDEYPNEEPIVSFHIFNPSEAAS